MMSTVQFSTGYLPFRPGLVYGDTGTENWLKNASKTLAKRELRTRQKWIKILEENVRSHAQTDLLTPLEYL